MENHRQPVDFSRGCVQHDQFDDNVTGLPLVSGQNLNGIPSAVYDPDGTGLPLIAAQISSGTTGQQPQSDQNVDNLPVESPPSSPIIHAENFHADPSDMANFIDQIMGRVPPPVFYNDNYSFPADAFMSAASAPLFMPQEPNTSFMDNMQQTGEFQTLTGNQTQTAPLYNVAEATANGISNSGQSAFSSSNYFFPVNNMIQQPSVYASNPSPTWQGSAPANQYGQYSAPPAAMFNPQAFNSFAPDASTIIRPQQPSPGNQLMNFNPQIPGISPPLMPPQFNSPNVINPLMPDATLPMMSQFNSVNIGPMMPQNSLSGSVAQNPMNPTTMMPGTYSLPVTVSATNALPLASFETPGRRVTFGPGMSARVELGTNASTSNAALSSPSGSSSSGTSRVGGSGDRNNQISGTASAHAGREVMMQVDSGTHASASSSQQGSSSRVETHQQMNHDQPIFNRVYDPRYAELGLPVDPFLRMFNQKPAFWKKLHGKVDVPKP